MESYFTSIKSRKYDTQYFKIVNFVPSKLVSMHHDKYQVSRFFSFASRSYFSKVRLSTIPVKYIIWPPIVDFPASTWPMNTTLTCSFSVVVASLTSGLALVLGLEAGTNEFSVPSPIEFSSSSGVVAGVAAL